MRFAIVGAGVSGLTAAAKLREHHDFVVYEAEDWIGGHTHTVDVEDPRGPVAVDTGFIVFNDWTYPEFIGLIDSLGVASQASDMSFSLVDEAAGLEYNGTSLNTLFAQRGNLLRPSFLGMLADILRFHRDAVTYLATGRDEDTLEAFLEQRRYGRAFRERYLVPMGRAIWSAESGALLGFPARFFIEFFHRHGFLSVSNRPVWRAISGGSREYVRALTAPFADRIRARSAVRAVHRTAQGVTVHGADGPEAFDAVLIACHADQALGLLAAPTDAEREVLGAIGYQPNDVVLHTDERLLPRRPLARAAWNYRVCDPPRTGCTLTYDMNVLQALGAQRRYLVSLNLTDRIDPARILGQWSYAHPIYTPAAVRAQQRFEQISGVGRTFYCGAYWRYGFHEDGVISGLRAARQIEQWVADAQRAL